MASCCAGKGAKPRGRQLVPGGVAGACDCSRGDYCACATCTCLGCPCKPDRVLTAALKRTGTPAQLKDLVQHHWGRLNSVHVSAALNSLAVFVSGERGENHGTHHQQQQQQQQGRQEDAFGEDIGVGGDGEESKVNALLLSALGKHAPKMSPRALSASVWTLAILRPSTASLTPVSPSIASAVIAHLERGTFECRDAAIVLWSYATLGPNATSPSSSHLPFDANLERAFEAYFLRGASSSVVMSPRDLSMVLWSAAALNVVGLTRSTIFVKSATKSLAAGAMKMEPRQLAQCLWGFATLVTTTTTTGEADDRGFGANTNTKTNIGEGGDAVRGVRTKSTYDDLVGKKDFGDVLDGTTRDRFLRTCAALVTLPRFTGADATSRYKNNNNNNNGVFVGGNNGSGGGGGGGGGANSHDIANALHAFAACRWYPGEEAMRVLSVAISSSAESFTAEEGADTMWAIATLQPLQPLLRDEDRARREEKEDPVGEMVKECASCTCGGGADGGDGGTGEAVIGTTLAKAAVNGDNDDDDATAAAVSDAVDALSHRLASLCASASPSSSSSNSPPSPCCFKFDQRATCNVLWSLAVLGRCARPEAAPLWRSARANIELRARRKNDDDDVGGAGIVQLFHSSWCYLEERSAMHVRDGDQTVAGTGMAMEKEAEAERGYAGESMLSTVRKIHKHVSDVLDAHRRRDSNSGDVRVKTSKLQLSVAAAAEDIAQSGVLRGVNVEAEVALGRHFGAAFTVVVDVLITLKTTKITADEEEEEENDISYVVEVDGPTHFLRSDERDRRRREVGGTALRNRLMRRACRPGGGGAAAGGDSCDDSCPGALDGVGCHDDVGAGAVLGGFVVLSYDELDEASRNDGLSGVVLLLRNALKRAGARV